MTLTESIVGTLIFVLIYASGFYLMDKNKEPLKLLAECFFLGFLSIGITIIFHIILPGMRGQPDEYSSPFFVAFYRAAFIEELAKSLVFMAFLYRHKEFNEWYDGILYGFLIGVGFGFLENIRYFTDFQQFGLKDMFVGRNFLSMPFHGVLTGIFGFFAGKSRFGNGNKKIAANLATGLGLSILLHGLYNYFLMMRGINLAILSLVVAAAGWALIFWMRKESQQPTIAETRVPTAVMRKKRKSKRKSHR